ncbi:hypothetical protein QJS04_geneDACA020806 [Acorus gramineus]|uniref:Uncharacterized protein n=1 Tax=Acorus gramineus TaxID=55184 RepID=A0AAV9BG02_ACOGR|nr:hypothetical protein QJS04_geneDACA020806 [Acorus gramineus]
MRSGTPLDYRLDFSRWRTFGPPERIFIAPEWARWPHTSHNQSSRQALGRSGSLETPHYFGVREYIGRICGSCSAVACATGVGSLQARGRCISTTGA